MSIRIGVVVDATCDLPESYFVEKRIGLLPIRIVIGNGVFADFRRAAETAQFYREHAETDAARFESTPPTVEEIGKVFLERLVVDYDFVFCITVSSARSATFENATTASRDILKLYRPHRAKAGLTTPFSMRVIDGQSFFSGTGALVAETVRMIESGASPHDTREHIEKLAPKICIHMVPKDTAHLRARGFKKGERRQLSDTLKSAALAVSSALSVHPVIRIHAGHEGPVSMHMSQNKAIEWLFKHAVEQMIGGHLLSPQLCLCYSGDPAEVRRMSGFAEVEAVARDRKIELLLTTMSITGLVNCGPGCLIVSYIGEPAA